MSVRCRTWKDKNGKSQESWQIDIEYRHVDGRVTRVKKKAPVQTRRGAEQHEREVRQALADGSWGKVFEEEQDVPTVSAFAKKFMVNARTHDKPSSVYSKDQLLKVHILPELGDKRLDEVGPFEIEKLKEGMLAKGLTAKTVNNCLSVLSRLLSLAEEWEVLKRVPKIRWMKVLAPPFDFLTFEEAERLVAAVETTWKTMMVVALNTGLRRGELRALRWDDVDLTAGRLMVRRSVWVKVEGTPKNRRQREVPLNDKALMALRAHRHLRGDFVFCKEDGSPVTNQMCRDAMIRTCKKAGLRHIGWHTLRHSFASHLVMLGRSLKEIQELLGHGTLEMTMRYAHLSPDVKKDAVKALNRAVVLAEKVLQ